jgi:lipid II:glycine glycyltransferase (peptidoglycan interpeptide bridge formation enzyme)
LFQALVGDRLLSSILVLRAAKGGYYHSAGTTAEGMACGASHWLVQHIAQALQSEGLQQFNLGGADEDGLVRFKVGFGSARVELEAADIQLAGPLMRLMTACGRSLGRLAGPMRELRLAWRGARPEGTR